LRGNLRGQGSIAEFPRLFLKIDQTFRYLLHLRVRKLQTVADHSLRRVLPRPSVFLANLIAYPGVIVAAYAFIGKLLGAVLVGPQQRRRREQ
jgi:hypothetical protein